MLEMFVVRETVFFLTGVMIGIGAIARLITGISLKKLVRAASNMSKSNHPLMRLVRAKFEHGCMVSDKVQNVGAFVEKYLYEYRVLGVRLHTWRQWAKGSIWLCFIFGATGTALAYAAGEREQGLYRYGILGGTGALALFLLRMLADDAYQLEAAKTYMVDFLENTYAHRYEIIFRRNCASKRSYGKCGFCERKTVYGRWTNAADRADSSKSGTGECKSG